MTKQTWTATVSAVLFVVLAAVIALVPVPYVTWTPGATYDLLGQVDGKDAITINGVDTYPTSGQLMMTTVSVTSPTSTLSLPEVLFSYWLPSREVLPRAAVYRPGEEPTDITEQETRLMNDSQSSAIVAALRQSGVEVTTWPMVTSVSNSGPSNEILKPGDLIRAVDGKTTTTVQDVQAIIGGHHVGESVVFTVLRNGVVVRPTVTTRATANEPDKPIVGITMAIGYSYSPSISFGIEPGIGGASGGVMFALAIHDRLSPEDIAADRVIAGSGTVDSTGNIGAVGAVQEKIAGAVRDQATVFILPRANCVDVGEPPAGIRLVPVETLAEATQALKDLTDPATAASVAGCS